MYAFPPGMERYTYTREPVKRWWEIPDDCPEVRVLTFENAASAFANGERLVYATPSAYVLSHISYDRWRRNDWADRPHP